MIQNLIFLFGFSAFATFAWIGLTVYHNSVTSNITPANEIKIEPIEPNFNVEAIEQLKSRQEVRANLSERAAIIGESDQNTTATESGSIETGSTSSPSATTQ